MKKNIKELQSKSVSELDKQVNDLRNEIAKLTLDVYANKPKNTNQVAMKKKQLAVVLTVLSAKRVQS